MARPRTALAELFTRIQRVDHLSTELELKFQELRSRRLVRREQIQQIEQCMDAALNEAWQTLERKISRSDFPVLIREDQVQERFHISQATLYRRRKTQEIVFIRDHEGIIWYPVVELIRYYLKSRAESRKPKTGRPRKF
jgi:transcription initiation factor TFIIIB Brf1 subunit/transcription initiation factor TFIIB